MLILPSLTTTKTYADSSSWREKLKEIKDMGLKEIALFPTAIGFEERQELYELLKETQVESIPFVHLRSDMSLEEVDYLFDLYGVKAANIHCRKYKPHEHDLSSYKSKIYIENCDEPISDEIVEWAGLCLDVSHQENKRLTGNPLFTEVDELMKKYPIGAWHLNAIRRAAEVDHTRFAGVKYDRHFYKDLGEFDYCVRFKDFLPTVAIALELENSIEEQLVAVEYVKQLLAL